MLFRSRNVLWTCNPEANYQIAARRLAFPKPTEVYGPLNRFGPTLPGTEGEEWRILRKVTGHSFHEGTNRNVWSYTCDRVQMLVRDWTGGGVGDLHEALARVTFHVISRVCFGKTISWPSRSSHEQEALTPNHKLSYGAALTSVFLHLPICFLTPSWLLHSLPLPVFRNASLALTEWQAYVEEMRQQRTKDLLASASASANPDLLTALVQASSSGTISPSALDGNIFVFHAAGHETAGSTLAFALLMLACFPSVQKKLHVELDSLLRSPSAPPTATELSYDKHFPALLDGYTGAILAETLRLFPVLSWLPKCTLTAQAITLNNKTYTVPADTLVLIAPDATHRNPKHWKDWELGRSDDGRRSNARGGLDLHAFFPGRWLGGEKKFHPVQGAYLPYSSGPRSCIGQRFAQVEMCATLAALLRDHRVELGAPVSGRPEMKEGSEEWEKVRECALSAMEKNIYFEMSLKMPVKIPLRLARRMNA